MEFRSSKCGMQVILSLYYYIICNSEEWHNRKVNIATCWSNLQEKDNCGKSLAMLSRTLVGHGFGVGGIEQYQIAPLNLIACSGL
jgi:hypothetical protein